jgi:sortase A
MRPDEQIGGQGGTPQLNQRPLSNNPYDTSPQAREAAINAVRNQVENIYNHQNSNPEILNKPILEKKQIEYVSPYQRTHAEHAQPQASQWKQYHSAWQSYYQKYYEGYYTHHLEKAKKELEQKNTNPDEQKQADLSNLKQQIISKIGQKTEKIKKSRHFIPILSGIIVVLIFAFIQFNQIITGNIAAFVSPGSIESQNIIIDPNSAVEVSADPVLIIPKINVNVPVRYDVGSDYDSQMAAMVNGVAHFAIPGANSHPGQIGNTVIAGHSSNDLFDNGDYKFIFAQLDRLQAGDTIYANYQSKRYTYIVTKKEIVKPTDVSKLVYETSKPIMTLVTCTPVGTAQSRLLVFAEQVSPDPNIATTAPDSDGTSSTNSIPGTAPTLLERLFGAN